MYALAFIIGTLFGILTVQIAFNMFLNKYKKYQPQRYKAMMSELEAYQNFVKSL